MTNRPRRFMWDNSPFAPSIIAIIYLFRQILGSVMKKYNNHQEFEQCRPETAIEILCSMQKAKIKNNSSFTRPLFKRNRFSSTTSLIAYHFQSQMNLNPTHPMLYIYHSFSCETLMENSVHSILMNFHWNSICFWVYVA